MKKILSGAILSGAIVGVVAGVVAGIPLGPWGVIGCACFGALVFYISDLDLFL